MRNSFGELYEDRTHTTNATNSCAVHYTNNSIILAEGTGFEPVITESKSDALGQTKLTPNKFLLVRPERFELPPHGFVDQDIIQLCYRRMFMIFYNALASV